MKPSGVNASRRPPSGPTDRTTIDIVPVIDLLGGRVVRGVAGPRSEYQAVESVLCAGADPIAVGCAFVEQLGLAEAYVADLNAIDGKAEPAWDGYNQIAQCGLALWVDCGLRDLDRTRALAEFGADGRPLRGVIAGLETLAGAGQLTAMFNCVGADRLVLSLDMYSGRPLTTSPDWQGMTVDMILNVAIEIGIRRFILLDLARIGTGEGVGTEAVCRRLRRRAPHVQIAAGGGIRDERELVMLARAGFDAALVASALHNGRIGKEDIRRARGGQ